MQLTKADKELINSLKSDNIKIVIATIEQFRVRGNTKLIPYVLDLLISTDNDEIKELIIALLNDLKDQSAVPGIISAIENKKYKSVLTVLLSSCWQSGLNYSAYYAFFTRLVIDSTYADAIEAFSVIEQSIDKYKISDKERLDQKEIIAGSLGKVDVEKAKLLKELVKVYE